jgi:gliding motility-associated lipoprotein GldD
MGRPLGVSAFFILLNVFLPACSGDYSPRPRGYFRVDFPERDYILYEGNCPYSFMYPGFSEITSDDSRVAMPCWINIDFPQFRGRLHISYIPVDNNIVEMMEDSRKLAFRHAIKADAIDEKLFINEQERVYGVLFDIKGNSASALQFFLTDSTRHFFRGALYFNVQPNKDSLAPVIDYFREDILHLIETFTWN